MIKLRIAWLTAEMGDYTSGGANHNRIFVDYLNKHPEVSKITIIRWPTPERGLLPPEKTITNGIEIFSPKIRLEMKNALNSINTNNLKFKERLKFAFLKLILKLKGLSTYDSTKIKKAGLFEIISTFILSFETPYPNPFWKTVAKCVKRTTPDIIQSQIENVSIAGALARDQAKAHLSFQYLTEGISGEAEEGTLEYELACRFSVALDWLIESNLVDTFLPVSETVKNYLIKFGANQNKMKIISSPIVIKNFPKIDKQLAREKLGLPNDKKIILSVGRMTARKRFQDIVEVLKKLPENVLLYIKRSSCLSDDVVDTSKRLMSLIEKNKLTNRVIINDTDLPYDQMVYVYSACDVAVYPFLDEPFGMCAAELMACNRPLIVYNSGFLPQFINKNGFIVEPLDPEDLYQKTKLLLEDEILAKEMGEKGKELAQKYDINVLGEKLINLYREFM